MVKNLHFQCWGHGFDPRSGNKDPHATDTLRPHTTTAELAQAGANVAREGRPCTTKRSYVTWETLQTLQSRPNTHHLTVTAHVLSDTTQSHLRPDTHHLTVSTHVLSETTVTSEA